MTPPPNDWLAAKRLEALREFRAACREWLEQGAVPAPRYGRGG
jgi:hypothetical protein